MDFSRDSVVKNQPPSRRCKFYPCVGKILWREKWQPTPVFCLENLMDRGAWQATVHGIEKSQIQLSDLTTIAIHSNISHIC